MAALLLLRQDIYRFTLEEIYSLRNKYKFYGLIYSLKTGIDLSNLPLLKLKEFLVELGEGSDIILKEQVQ